MKLGFTLCSWDVGAPELRDWGIGLSVAGGAGSGFRVGWRTSGQVWFPFFKSFLLVLAGLSFWRGHWRLGYPSMEFGQFPDIS